MPSESGEDSPVATRPVFSGSAEEAESEATRWLDCLVESGRYDWEWVEPLQIKAQPTPNLPCRVLGIAAQNPDGGHSPLLMLMAGKRRRRRYWQYTTREVGSGKIHPQETALEDIEWLVGALKISAELPPLPRPRRPAGDARNRRDATVDEEPATAPEFVITKHGRSAAVAMGFEDYESLRETINTLSDAKTMKALAEAEDDLATGRLFEL